MKLVILLLENGASVTVRNKRELTPLQYAHVSAKDNVSVVDPINKENDCRNISGFWCLDPKCFPVYAGAHTICFRRKICFRDTKNVSNLFEKRFSRGCT